ncbi:hypothetical protein MCOR02_003837 [Pyricularia oryzae]|nr:hypothetical protein MCOR02_003837 [Pyricularia oryzae]
MEYTANLDTEESKRLVLNAAIVPAERITRSADRPGGWDLKTRTPITGMWCHLSEDMIGLPYRQFFMILKCPDQDGKAGCSRIGLFDVNVVSPQNEEVCNYNNGDRRDWVIY